jgi:hypothetical protein
MRTLAAAIILATLAATCPAQQPDPTGDPLYVSDTLFPESRGWTPLSSTPSLSEKELASIKAQLEQAYRVSDDFDPGCPFVERVFKSPNVSAFHRVDVDNDGIPDIVYSNDSVCGDGDDAVIWHGTATGYVMEPGASWSATILRIAPDGTGITSATLSSGGDETSTYSRGNFKDPSGNHDRTQDVDREVALVDDTAMPTTRYAHPVRFLAHGELRLRTQPAIDDAYDPSESEFLRLAAFGNVARIYLPGSGGGAVGEKTVNGQRWLFVVMDEESDQLASNDPYVGVCAGWVQANKVVFDPK